jgi:hypothetical protein
VNGPVARAADALATGAQGDASFIEVYPHITGVHLGRGWSNIFGGVAPSTCIEFSENKEIGRELQMTFGEVVDHESQQMSLSANIAGQTNLGIATLRGGVDTRNERHITSDTVSLFFSATVRERIESVRPTDRSRSNAGVPNFGRAQTHLVDSVKLTAPAVQLLQNDPASFFRHCGEYFVSSIYYGTTIRAMLRFQWLSVADRSSLRASLSAAPSAGELLGGVAATSHFSSIISTLKTQKKLSIDFHQIGDQISVVPVSLEALRTAVTCLRDSVPPGAPVQGTQTLPNASCPQTNSADQRGRIMAAAFTSYRTLPNFMHVPQETTLLTRAVRYYARLQSILHEAVRAREELSLTVTQLILAPDNSQSQPKQFYFDPFFQQEARTRLPRLIDDLNTELRRVERIISSLQNASCAGYARITRCDLKSEDTDQEFSDFRFRVRLPVPSSAVPEKTAGFLGNSDQEIELRKFALVNLMFSHHIERMDSFRCRTMGECLTSNQRLTTYCDIQESVYGADKPLGGICPERTDQATGTPAESERKIPSDVEDRLKKFSSLRDTLLLGVYESIR